LDSDPPSDDPPPLLLLHAANPHTMETVRNNAANFFIT
jgi:hypothetical protein